MAQAGVPMWDIAGYLGHADTRMAERTYAHHHPDYQDKPARTLAEALAGIGAAEAPALRKLAARDADKIRARRAARHQKRHQSDATGEQNLTDGAGNPLKSMVGATGFEPVTPTMST